MKHCRSLLPPAIAVALTTSLVLGLALPAPVAAQTPKPAAPAAPSKPPAAAPAPAPAAQAKPVVVNGKPIPASRIEFFIKQNTAPGQPENEQVRRAVTDRLVNTEILAQEAEKRGLNKNSDAQIQLDFARQNALAELVVQDYFKSRPPVTEQDLRSEYERLKLIQSEYKARHILVEKEDEAKDIIAKLKAGGNFNDLAKVSKDAGNKDQGGDLGWNQPGRYVRPFAEALLRMNKGATSETPVQTEFGWHVIRLDDVRLPAQFPEYEQAKPQIVGVIRERLLQALVQDLRSKSKIE